MGIESSGIARIRTAYLRRRWLATATAVGVAVTAAAAIPTGPAAASNGIQFTSNTVQISTATIKSQLLSVSKDGATYTFKSKHGVVGKLAAGKVMLLQDVTVRDVKKTKTSHGHFVVTTTPAAITDFVRNGTFSLSKSIAFSKGFVLGGAAAPAEDAVVRNNASVPAKFGMVPLAKGGFTLKGKVDGYEYSVNFTPSGKSVAVAITISRSKPIDLEVKITGTLDNLKTAGKIAVNKGKLSSAKMLANNIQGSFKLEYSAKPVSQFGLGQAGGIKIELPAEIAVPFFIGPVPFFLGIKVAFFASAGFSSFDQELSGSYTFKYDGAGGMSITKDGATSAAGVLKGLADIILKAANAVRTGPLSFVFGAQMPQIELGLGVKGLNIAGNVTLVGSTEIATQGSGCDTRKMEILGTAGASAKAFGFSGSFGNATLFDKTINASWPRGCGVAP